MRYKISFIVFILSAVFLTYGYFNDEVISLHQPLNTDSLLSSNLSWAGRIANSFLIRHPGAVTFDEFMTKDRWDYEQGLMLESLRQMFLKTGEKKYFEFIKGNIDRFVSDDGKIRTYGYAKFNLDNVNTGRQLLFLFKETGEENYKIAADTLRKQLKYQPRTNAGGFWHKKVYPSQMWLDGIYMAEPFYAGYIKMFGDSSEFCDVSDQIITIYENTVDPGTGLLYHAWDESRRQKWADPITGKSKIFWGRSIGWFVMAVVDVLDYLPENHKSREKLIRILGNVCEALVNVKDKETGLWYQVLDKHDAEGNYLEASCAAMFAYAFAKGANKGYLNKKYREIAADTFESIIKNHVKVDKNGFVNLLNTCAGAGLGGNPYRDGSFEYYISEPTRKNDFKGYGPLLMAAIELEK